MREAFETYRWPGNVREVRNVSVGSIRRRREITIQEAAFRVMEKAYLKASGGGKLPAHARQIMYTARGEIQAMTSRQLNDQYFTQQLLPNYLEQNPDSTSNWDVVFDARGHFVEPQYDWEAMSPYPAYALNH